jgi:hypothetical protein
MFKKKQTPKWQYIQAPAGLSIHVSMHGVTATHPVIIIGYDEQDGHGSLEYGFLVGGIVEFKKPDGETYTLIQQEMTSEDIQPEKQASEPAPKPTIEQAIEHLQNACKQFEWSFTIETFHDQQTTVLTLHKTENGFQHRLVGTPSEVIDIIQGAVDIVYMIEQFEDVQQRMFEFMHQGETFNPFNKKRF